jgi:hypothetical protein
VIRSDLAPVRRGTMENQDAPASFGLSEVAMRCLRIYATPDGESHFGDADIPTTTMPLFPNEAPFQLSCHYRASRIRFVRSTRRSKRGWHIPPGRVLAVWLDGIVEFETSDGSALSCGWEFGVGRGYAWKRAHLGAFRRGTELNLTLPHGLDRLEFG